MKLYHFLLFITLLGCKTTDQTFSFGETIELAFKGPETSETANDNPFLNYRLEVEFSNGNDNQTIRGFYSADGNAAESSAESGNIWKVRYLPPTSGKWTYKAKLLHGENIAINLNEDAAQIELSNESGAFVIDKRGMTKEGLIGRGVMQVKNGYLQFPESNEYMIKVGANSPENFLAFADFDQTYRIEGESREGESKTNLEIHSYTDHVTDWQKGDPTWKQGKGKGIIGAVNYLASKGMNSIYFLTFNTTGDGRDVWMYNDPQDFSRFDVSKLEQWEILFKHMQAKGIILHFVLQETENETLLDNGNTGPERKLYLLELISRFGHHPAIIWNIGEENGPNNWSKSAQTDAQRKDMINFIKQNDPYKHPVVIHTLPNNPDRNEVLLPLQDLQTLDGISLQDHAPNEVNESIKSYREVSKGRWFVSMDEIGPWHTGALADTVPANHQTLMREVLWGTLLAGGGGVEWYFGAKQTYNDLTSESWKVRDHLWTITNHAKVFFQTNLPYHEMSALEGMVDYGYAFGKKDEIYTFYLFANQAQSLNLTEVTGSYKAQWFNPNTGGMVENAENIEIGSIVELSVSPFKNSDVVLLLKRK
ncbi:MAG: DUF5060 domain-containing protein [Thalassobius sp.]|nr:DUF5060 domain-containing protein [Thalassovita sp.]